jgi:hypothetical protein
LSQRLSRPPSVIKKVKSRGGSYLLLNCVTQRPPRQLYDTLGSTQQKTPSNALGVWLNRRRAITNLFKPLGNILVIMGVGSRISKHTGDSTDEENNSKNYQPKYNGTEKE